MGEAILGAVQAVGTWVGNGLVVTVEGLGAVGTTITDGTVKLVQTIFFLG
jgi:hypothetical protein